jgi:hypothetical protein
MFRAGNRRLVFIRNYGAGTQSQAQLVHDVDTSENMVRKVTAHRLVSPEGQDSSPNWRPKPPREVRILRTIKKSFQPPEPGRKPYLAECYGHEYIRTNSVDDRGRRKYHSASYWKLYNGQSIRERWLSGDVLPPSVAVARMIRQFLVTLHYLYTGGLKPIYHEDTHFGNIWAHWQTNNDDDSLPDFYLGDFADASQDGSKYATLSLQEKVLIGRPVNDLEQFVRNLDLLLDIIGQKRGYGDGRLALLRQLAKGIWDVVGGWKRAADTDAPPDLRHVIGWAEWLEKDFDQGGQLDETRTDVYKTYVTEERRLAREVEGERGLVVVGDSVKHALRPSCRDGLRAVPMAVHGPWQLVWADTLIPVEGGGVTHHRPNGARGRYDEKQPDLVKSKKGKTLCSLFKKKDNETAGLSDSDKRPGVYDGGFLDEYSEGEVSDGPYTPLFQSEPEPESPLEPVLPSDDTSDFQSQSSENVPEQLPDFSSIIPRDDELFLTPPLETIPEESPQPSSAGSIKEPSPQLLSFMQRAGGAFPHPSSPGFLAAQVSALFLGDETSPQQPELQEAEKPVPRWDSAQEPGFYVKDLLDMEGLRVEDTDKLDMQQFKDQCKGQFRHDRQLYDKTATELRSKQQAKQTGMVSLMPPERFEAKAMRWHMLVHDVHCRCNRWTDEVEAILRTERTRRVLTGFREVNLSVEEPFSE